VIWLWLNLRFSLMSLLYFPALMLEMGPSQGPKGFPFIRSITPPGPLQYVRRWEFSGF